ncbi:hypothetical protein Tco_1297090 [Tanacetum coccineum]
MNWRTTKNAVDCGLFVMRHMEMYNGSGVWINNMKNEKEGQKSEINFFRAKYLAKILLLPYNTSKEELLKEANEKWKKQQNKTNTVTNMDVKVDKNLMKNFNKGKRLEVFIEDKGKEEKSDDDVPDIKKGRSKSTSISIESIADHTGAKKKFFGKKSVVEPHPISFNEYNDSESDSEYRRIIKKTKVKRTTIEDESVASKRKKMGKTMTDVKNKNKKFDDVESDMDSTQVKRKKKYLKKKGKLVAEDSKITKKDLRKKGKMVVPIDEDEELTDEDDREYFKSKKFQVLKNILIQNLQKGNLLLDEIDHKLDQASVLNPEDDQLKKIIKKRNNLFYKSYIGGKKDSIDAKVDFKSKDGVTEDDIWVDNGKSIVPFDDFYILNSDSSLLETQSDENNTQSVDMQFDEITVQDDADKKMVKERRFNVIKVI